LIYISNKIVLSQKCGIATTSMGRMNNARASCARGLEFKFRVAQILYSVAKVLPLLQHACK